MIIFSVFMPILCTSWGFTAHKTINYAAVFILPPEMFGFYKSHITYLYTNSVKPDMRRYVNPHEGPRHYLDVDFYETQVPLDTLPFLWDSAVARYGLDSVEAHGIVPWHIIKQTHFLSKAFVQGDYPAILRLSADLGHYVADLHVPLHTTENYNGQLTDQKGIHGLWESRLVELLMDKFDLFVGQAFYINDVQSVVWRTLEESYGAKDSVLELEKVITAKVGEHKKYTFEERNGQVVKTYSRNFRRAYNKSLNEMVERRLRSSIQLVASVWMTAWVDAGQPELDHWALNMEDDISTLDSIRKKGQILGREESH